MGIAGGDTNRRLGANVTRLRRLHRMSQADLVAKMATAGVPMLKTTLSKLENADRKTTVDEVVGLAEALNVSVGALLYEPARCDACHDQPPTGFTCNACGVGG